MPDHTRLDYFSDGPLGIEPVEVEMLIFVGQSPGQWAEAWLDSRLPSGLVGGSD